MSQGRWATVIRASFRTRRSPPPIKRWWSLLAATDSSPSCAPELGLDLSDDPRFATNSARAEHRDELYPLLAAALAKRPAAEWTERLNAAGVPCGPVNDIAQAFAFAERLGLEPVLRLVRDGSTIAQVANPISLSRTPVSYRYPPPYLRDDTAVDALPEEGR